MGKDLEKREKIKELAKTYHQSEIGRILGLSRERVRQICKQEGIVAQPCPEEIKKHKKGWLYAKI